MLDNVAVPVSFDQVSPDAPSSPGIIEVDPNLRVEISPSTIEALQLASRLAAQGHVRLVHATPDVHRFSMYSGPEGMWLPADTTQQLDRAAKGRSQLVLQELAARYLRGAEVELVIAPGTPVTVVLDAVASHRTDAIIMAASGRGPFRRALGGSTANKLIRRSPCPVIVVPGPGVPAASNSAKTAAP
ncbi:MAG: universal stress protein [Deltaproteobacteria bacterium]|nr:universal stress protein [Deltaproteobacteria bacterium]